jgi:hypothetical protein
MKIKKLSKQFDLGFGEIDDQLGADSFQQSHAKQLVAGYDVYFHRSLRSQRVLDYESSL